jgi:polyhydroxybutyrate depolymerase
MYPLAAAVVGALLVSACAAAPAPATDRAITLPSRDGDRTVLVHHPTTAGPGSPLVVVLHGAGDTAADVQANLGWDGLADREGVVVAYPAGLDRTWNAGRCCGAAVERHVDDVAYLDALVAALRDSDGIGRVYAVGFSNGAMMSYAWACARPGALAGIGPVAGALLVDCPAPAPLTVVAVHGTADERVPIGGGPGPSGTPFPSLDGSLEPFRATGCPAEPAVADTFPARVSTWACANGRAVVRDVVDGLPHVWPGAGPNAGTTEGPLDATGFIWVHLRGA